MPGRRYDGGVDDPRLVIIGGGTMARALVLGCIDRGVVGPGGFVVVEPQASARGVFEQAGVATLEGIGELGRAWRAAWGAQVVLAVKPQSLREVGEQWTGAGLGGFSGVVITILAGMPSGVVRGALGGKCRVVRAMPNLPARIGQGASAIALGAGAHAGDEAFALSIFKGVGPVVELIDEPLMDAVTALSGSGPAYLFYLAEAMVRGGVEAGLPEHVADTLTRQTLLGAAALLAGSPGEAPSALRASVTSKGGTTEAAMTVLEARGVRDAITKAVSTARDRGRELAREHGA